MEEIKKVYHITEKNNLYNIQKKGLEPRIGRRSNSVDECDKLLFFTDNLYLIFIWKNKLYKNKSFNDLAILTFDIPNNKYIKRNGNSSDCFITDKILPENISLIQFTQKEKTQNENALETLENIFTEKAMLDAIKIMNENYEILMQPITELSIEKPMFDNDKKRKVIEILASYEHKKWAEDYDRLNWTAKKNSDGSIEISQQDIHESQEYIDLNYKEIERFYEKDIRKAVIESFLIMQENNAVDDLGISDEELISILKETEYKRRNRWSKYMLSICSVKDSKYVIPKEKAQLFRKEMLTPYSQLTEQQKESYRKETENIFDEIEKYKSTNQNKTPLQEREDKLTKLEQESEMLAEELIKLEKSYMTSK